MIFSIKTKSKKINNERELENYVDHLFTHSKHYLIFSKTKNNTYLYRDNNKVIEDINYCPSVHHKRFSEVISKESIANRYSAGKKFIFFSININGVYYSNIIKSFKNNQLELHISEDIYNLIAENSFKGSVNAFDRAIQEELRNVDEVFSFDEMSEENKNYLTSLLSSNNLKDNTLISMCHAKKDNIIELHSLNVA